MPIARFQMPDGRVARFEVPDGTTPEQAHSMMTSHFAAPAEAKAPAAATAQPLSRMDKFTKGLRDPLDGGAQLLANMLPEGIVSGVNKANNWLADKTGLVGRLPEGGVDQQVREGEAQYQARRTAGGETGMDGYRLTGNVLNPANLALASRIPAAATLAGRIGIGAATGAAFSSTTPVGEGDFATEKAKQIATGAAFGGALPVATNALARVINPNAASNANLQLLKNEGVRPTIGQALGGRMNSLEEKLQSVPIFGDAIGMARRRGQEDFNKAAITRAASPVGAKAEGIGHDGVRQAGDAISDAYKSALNKISGVQLDNQFGADLSQLQNMSQGLTTEMGNKFNRTLQELVMRKVSQAGSILPDDYKAIDSELGRIASQYGKSSAASEQELSAAVQQLQSLLKQQMVRSNPNVAQELKAADTAWANLVRVEGAAKSAKNAEGVFTPGQLNMAIQTADDSVRKRAVSRGNALMQDLGNAGQTVLGNREPDSGTVQRLLYGGGALGSYLINPLIPASLLGGAAMYTPQMQRALVAVASSRPAGAGAAANALARATPYLSPASGQFGNALMNND